MEASFPVIFAISAGDVLRYALAFFLVLFAIGVVYALVRTGRALDKVNKLVSDLDEEIMPVIRKGGATLDQVNSELEKVNDITQSVADMTARVDSTTRAVESAIATPAKKAASFTAGLSQAITSLFHRGGAAAGSSGSAGAAAGPYESQGGAGPYESAAGPDASAAADAASAAAASTTAPSHGSAGAADAQQAAADPVGEGAAAADDRAGTQSWAWSADREALQWEGSAGTYTPPGATAENVDAAGSVQTEQEGSSGSEPDAPGGASA